MLESELLFFSKIDFISWKQLKSITQISTEPPTPSRHVRACPLLTAPTPIYLFTLVLQVAY